MFTRTGLILYVDNYTECVEFYSAVLGLPVLFENDELTCFNLGSSYLMVEPSDAHIGGPPNAARTCLRMNVQDVQAMTAKLRGSGVEVDLQEHTWGTVAKFHDPAGNLCAFKDDVTFERQVSLFKSDNAVGHDPELTIEINRHPGKTAVPAVSISTPLTAFSATSIQVERELFKLKYDDNQFF